MAAGDIVSVQSQVYNQHQSIVPDVRGQEQGRGQGQGCLACQAPAQRLTRKPDSSTRFHVYQGATRGMCGAQIARELRLRRQTVTEHLNRQEELGWIRREKGDKSPIRWERGINADEADRLLLRTDSHPAIRMEPTDGQLSQATTDHSTLGGSQPPTGISQLQGASLTMECRVHHVRSSAPVLGKFPITEFRNVKRSTGMRGVTRWDFTFGGLRLYLMGPTLAISFPDAVVNDGPGLIRWRNSVVDKFDSLQAALLAVGAQIGPMGPPHAEYAFPDYGDFVAPVYGYIFQNPEAWTDSSTGRMEYETRSFRLALLYYYLPSVVAQLVRDVGELKGLLGQEKGGGGGGS